MNTTAEIEFDYQTHMNKNTRDPVEIHRGPKAREKRREAAKARISQNNQLSEVLQKIQEIAEKSADGSYIYRGEPEHYEKVSSSLYREHPEIETEHFDIEIIQNEIIEAAKRYTSETDDFEILTELQHYGGATNLIDFTSDFHIALFFSCDGSEFLDKDGRVILLQKTKRINEQVEIPQNPRNRVIVQKSIFVRPPEGFIKLDHVINIPKDLKLPMLNHLRKYHGISTETIYNDLHGFIRYQSVHQSAYAEFYAGLTCQNKEDYPKAIKHYDKAIELNPQMVQAYNNRGNAYSSGGEVDRPIADYNKAIDIDSEFALAYFNRGNFYSDKGAYDRAIEDYSKAIELNPKFAEAYYNNRGNAYVHKGAYDRAIEDCNKAIDLNPKFAMAYCNRGHAYVGKGNLNHAIADYDKAIGLNPDDAEVYTNRGMCWLHLQNWQVAKSDLTVAKSMGTDIIATFRNTYRNGEEFEQRNGVQLPEDIAAMLTP